MTTRTFSLVVGIVFLLVGLLGFIDALKSLPPTDAPTLSVSAGYDYLFELFPVNMLHNFVHLGIGFWGLTSYRNYPAARTFTCLLCALSGHHLFAQPHLRRRGDRRSSVSSIHVTLKTVLPPLDGEGIIGAGSRLRAFDNVNMRLWARFCNSS